MVQPIDPNADVKARLQELLEQNAQTEKSLAMQGANVQQSGVVAVRLNQLVNTLLGKEDDEDPVRQRARLEYEINIQEQFAKLMADTQTQINFAKLTQGVNLQDPRRN